MGKRETKRDKDHWIRRVLGLGVLAGIAYAIWREIEANRDADSSTEWEPQPFPFPPQPRTGADRAGE
jgi:hypothetical protein